MEQNVPKACHPFDDDGAHHFKFQLLSFPPFNPVASSVECHDSLPYLSPTLLNTRFTAWVRGLKKRLSKFIDTYHQSTRATLRMPTTRP